MLIQDGKKIILLTPTCVYETGDRTLRLWNATDKQYSSIGFYSNPFKRDRFVYFADIYNSIFKFNLDTYDLQFITRLCVDKI